MFSAVLIFSKVSLEPAKWPCAGATPFTGLPIIETALLPS